MTVVQNVIARNSISLGDDTFHPALHIFTSLNSVLQATDIIRFPVTNSIGELECISRQFVGSSIKN